MTTARRGTWLLIAGALVGAVLAGREFVRRSTAITPDAAAIVNGVAIARAEFEQALRAVENDRGSPLTEADRKRVLDQLIGEELLYARALKLDLPRRDARLHAEIVSTFVNEVIAPAEMTEPSDADLLEYFTQHVASFAAEPLVRIEALLFALAADAEDAARRLRAGESLQPVAAKSAPFPLAVPTTLSTRESLTTALGPTAARTALTLAQGDVSDPIRTTDGHVVLRVVQRRASPPQLADVRQQVRAALIRERGEQRLRDTIAELRSHADVRLPR